MELNDEGKQLPVTHTTSPIAAPTVPPAPLKDVKLAPGVLNAPKPTPLSFPKEETEQYVCENGVYRCKLCSKFMTGSHESLQAHIGTFHNSPAKVAKPTPKFGEDDNEGTLVASSSKGGSTAGKQPPTEPDLTGTLDEDALDAGKGKSPQESLSESSDVFQCTHQGCSKEFSTERGLNQHIARVHK